MPSVWRPVRLRPVYLRRHNAFPSEKVVVVVDTWDFAELRVSTPLDALYERVRVFLHTMLRGRVVADSTATLVIQLVDRLLHLSYAL